MRVVQALILVPVLVQVGTTILTLLALGRARASGQKTAIANAEEVYRSQFELPVLFYAAAALAYSARVVDTWFLIFAVLFALTRIAHVVLHIRAQDRPMSAAALRASVVALLALWALLALDMLGPELG